MSGDRGMVGVGGSAMDGLSTLGLRATLTRASGHVRLLRLLALVAPFVVLGSTMAAHGAVQPIACVVFAALALACALSSDAHVGLLTMLLLGLNWVQTVDDQTTAWVLPAAMGLVVLHTSLAAISVAPPAARWRGERARVWARRSVLACAAAVPAWVLSVAVVDRAWSGSTVLLAAALTLAAAGAAWIRGGGVRT